MPNATGGFFQIKPLKPNASPTETQQWTDHLNFVLRSMQDRIDALGGQRGQTLHENDINLNTHKLINVTDPTADQDAATKNYVDDQFAIRGL